MAAPRYRNIFLTDQPNSLPYTNPQRGGGHVHIIVQDKHIGCYDLEAMRVLGLNPQQSSIIVVKLGYLEPELRSIAKRSILALTDGSSNEVLENLEYKNIKRPMYPFDKKIPNELIVQQGGFVR